MKKRYSDNEVMFKNSVILLCPSDGQGSFIWMEGAIQNLLDISSGSCHSFTQFNLYWLSMGTSFQPERKQEKKKKDDSWKGKKSLPGVWKRHNWYYFPRQETSVPGSLSHELDSTTSLWVEDIYRLGFRPSHHLCLHKTVTTNSCPNAWLFHMGPGYLNSGSHAWVKTA